MPPENVSPLPSNPGQGATLAAPVLNDGGPGMSDSEAAARIRDKIAPRPARKEDGKFISLQAPTEQPAATPRQPIPHPADGAAPIEEPDADAADAIGDEAAQSDDDELEFEDGTDAEPQAPSVDMPESWGKTAEAIWSALPPEAQTFLKQHEAKRTQGITRQLNELKAEQEKVSTAQAAIQQQELQVAQAAQRYALSAERDFLSKFSDLKSQEDVVKLASENPARYLQYDAALKSAMAARQEAQMFDQQQAQAKLKELTDFRMAENQKLAELADINDEASATAFEKQIHGFAEQIGIPKERIAQYRAEEILLMRDAMRYRNAVAKKTAAQKAAAPLPKVIRPGAQPQSGSLSRETQIAQLSQKLRKTGSEKDAAALIKAKVFGARR